MPDIINSGSIVFRLAIYFSVSSEAMRYLGLILVPEVLSQINHFVLGVFFYFIIINLLILFFHVKLNSIFMHNTPTTNVLVTSL